MHHPREAPALLLMMHWSAHVFLYSYRKSISTWFIPNFYLIIIYKEINSIFIRINTSTTQKLIVFARTQTPHIKLYPLLNRNCKLRKERRLCMLESLNSRQVCSIIISFNPRSLFNLRSIYIIDFAPSIRFEEVEFSLTSWLLS